MKTHLAQNGFSRAADLVDDKRKSQPHFVCGQWAPSVQRQPGMVMVAAGRPVLALLAVHSIETISTSILSYKRGIHWVS